MHKRTFLARILAAISGSVTAVTASTASAQEWPLGQLIKARGITAQ